MQKYFKLLRFSRDFSFTDPGLDDGSNNIRLRRQPQFHSGNMPPLPPKKRKIYSKHKRL
jgi:hypothetical protein